MLRGRRTPLDAFAKASEKADRLAARGKADQATEVRTEALGTFVDDASASELRQASTLLEANLHAVISTLPREGLEIFKRVRWRVSGVARDMAPAVLRARVESESEPLQLDWFDLETIFLAYLEEDPDRFIEILARALPAVDPSDEFSRAVVARVLTRLDETMDLASSSTVPLLTEVYGRVLLVLANRARDFDHQLGEDHVFCALGDMARGDEQRRAEMLARYRVAAERGLPEAGVRVAYCISEDAHRLLVSGDIDGARRSFHEALKLHDDPWYQYFAVLVDLLDDAGPPADCAARLEKLDGELPERAGVAFWLAVAHLKEGHRDEAADELRTSGADAASGAAGGWGLSDEARVLLAALEADERTLVETARRLVREDGDDVLRERPIVALPMLAAVARHDLPLLADLVTALRQRESLPQWLRLVGAHAQLLVATSAIKDDAWPDGESAIALANELLEV